MAELKIESPSATIFRHPSDAENFKYFLNSCLANEDYEIFPLAGDASSRRYYRVVHSGRSLVLMAWEPFVNPDQFPFLNVQRLFKLAQVQVPEVIAFDENKGLILLEDLGDLTLERKFWENQDQRVSLPFYKQALDELIQMHFASQKVKMQSTAFSMRFDTEKLMWEMNYAIDHMLLKFCKVKLSESGLNTLKQSLLGLCNTLSDHSVVVCHRDYHSRNTMIKHGKMRIIDFQDARMGPMQYDLVSLFKDSYVDLNAAMQTELLEYYLDRAESELGKKIKNDEFMEIYEKQTVQRCFKACGSFTSFYNSREDLRYLKYIHKTINEVYASTQLFKDLKPLKDIIEQEGLLTKNYESV